MRYDSMKYGGYRLTLYRVAHEVVALSKSEPHHGSSNTRSSHLITVATQAAGIPWDLPLMFYFFT